MDKDPTVIVYTGIALAVIFSILGYLVSGFIRRVETNGHDGHQASIKEFLQNVQPSNPDPNKERSEK